ncbi:hypothetical protein CAOG_03025 [Capsaspora owczarzaki ATCC 30864]|uniref:LRRNT domain-containing protein n=1 Tax=Capsaspora owczarzaki (strain ATCC 30864) TaxID=595528 RepID=A0A0D2WNJ7_CAPO3|nr:hypothetical protein CAOG_03025 [Capsaspora owczarzaki ATCC 30864]KJE91983.1 hypothetical protein CAOG_003025 [Capsaspora owczarzaki ATCC 30864]|eukprot:XP_004363864.1 hypothetical protein CAOG_03025 [Capsaspora owczarzaki ATCC 30864]
MISSSSSSSSSSSKMASLALFLCIAVAMTVAAFPQHADAALSACSVCTCASTFVECRGLSEMPESFPTNVEVIFFRDSSLTIPSGAFANLASLYQINLEGTYTSFTNDIFPRTVRNIIMSSPYLTQLPTGAFAGLSTASIINLAFPLVTTLNASDFAGLTSLRRLELTLPNLTSIEDGFFTSMPLTVLSIPGTKLTSLSSLTLAGLTSLSELYMFNSPLVTVAADAFASLTSVRWVLLTETQLTSLPSGFLASSQLVHVNMEGSLISSIAVNAFSSSLQELRISRSRLTSFPVAGLSNLAGLASLDLSNSNITSIPADAITPFASSLRNLALSNNPITSVSGGALLSTSLKSLSMLGTQLTSVPADIVSGNAPALTSLAIGGSELSQLSDGTFNYVPALTSLYLSGSFTQLSDTIFSSQTNLQLIDLSSSNLADIPINTLKNLPALRSIVLARTKITTVPSNAFASGFPQLSMLNLNDNRIASFPSDAFTGPALTGLYLSGTDILAVPSDIPTLTFLELARTKFTSAPANAFSNFTQLNGIDLSGALLQSLPTLPVNCRQVKLAGSRITSLSSNLFGNSGSPDFDLSSMPLLTTLPPGLFYGLDGDFGWTLNPNFFAPGAAPPSTFYATDGSVAPCNVQCATCFSGEQEACCPSNCLRCSSSTTCTQCYDGFGAFNNTCVPASFLSSVAAVLSTSSAVAASAASTASASVATTASAAAASAASISAELVSISRASAFSVAAMANAAGNTDAQSNVAPIVGAIVGGVAFLALLAVVAVLRRRRSSKSSSRTSSGTTSLRSSISGSDYAPAFLVVPSSKAGKPQQVKEENPYESVAQQPVYEHVGVAAGMAAEPVSHEYANSAHSAQPEEGLYAETMLAASAANKTVVPSTVEYAMIRGSVTPDTGLYANLDAN